MSRGPSGPAGRRPTGSAGSRPGGPTRPGNNGNRRVGCPLTMALPAALILGVFGMTACHPQAVPAESPRPLMSGRQATP